MAHPAFSRRSFLAAAGCAPFAVSTDAYGASLLERGEVVSVRDFGAVASPGVDNTAAIQRAIDAVQSRGGGVVHIPETYECGGNIVISRDGVTLHGPGAWLVNARVTIAPGCEECRIEGLGILDNRGDDTSYLLDVRGRHCTFDNVSLVQDPAAGGYQLYVRPQASHCRFTGLRTRGSSGIFVAGHDHVFSGFHLEAKMEERSSGDDGFALKAPGTQTSNILIENGVMRGYASVLSIGSEVGTPRVDSDYSASVRNVTVRNVEADRCARILFIKPGALIYDYRNGLIEDVVLDDVRLSDPTGYSYVSAIMVRAARGAIVRRVTARRIAVRARARALGLTASGIEVSILDLGAPARIEDVDLQLSFVDPHDGAAHGPGAPGYPIDHVAIVKKFNREHGSMANISLDVAGRGTRFGGIFVGAGLDDAVRIRRARLQRIGVNPPATVAGGGIWSDSRVQLEDVQVEALNNRPYGGAGLRGRSTTR